MIPALVINLDTDVERYARLQPHMAKLRDQFAFERLPAVRMIPGWRGCIASHVKALDLALERGYDRVAIFEDDFELTAQNPRKIMSELSLDRCDVCILAYLPWETSNFSMLTRTTLRVHGGELSWSCAYIVNHTFMRTLRDWWATHDMEPVDVSWRQLFVTNTFACSQPPLGRQAAVMSTLSGTENKINPTFLLVALPGVNMSQLFMFEHVNAASSEHAQKIAQAAPHDYVIFIVQRVSSEHVAKLMRRIWSGWIVPSARTMTLHASTFRR